MKIRDQLAWRKLPSLLVVHTRLTIDRKDSNIVYAYMRARKRA